ncbi:hypothetical protein RFI_02526 [Reticulomyxa filosa]|uniref:DUF4238 domain-containing protein n=1 Tax=Reticulomyxa filosa TaxID=46433 RepID=X6P8P3_RETFI|nr:hypothetical protein RFI_02526 [Reticulomyxa filosa]|eukprot:ETO34571.1 hypothetical protein RFI_02526 [Reticulomyxa filosa]
MNQYTANHFIPSTYLKQWYITEQPYYSAFRYQTEIGKYKKMGFFTPGNSYVKENQLYWLDTKDEKNKISIENAFAKKEQKLGKVFKKLKSTTQDLDLNEKRQILDFSAKQEAENQIKYMMFKQSFTFDEYYHMKMALSLDEEIRNLPISGISQPFWSRSKQNFIRDLGKGSIFIYDVSKSDYVLITSNYPVIYNNLFSADRFDICFPFTPNKVFFCISEKSIGIFRDMMKTFDINDLVIQINKKTLKQHINNPIKEYQIFSNTTQLEKVLDKKFFSEFFVDEVK